MSHIVGTMDGVVIETVGELEILMGEVIERLKLTEVGKCFHQFEPIGATGVIILAESHFSAHTYPEFKNIYFDLFCCTPYFSERCTEAALCIKEIFKAQNIKWEKIDRIPKVQHHSYA